MTNKLFIGSLSYNITDNQLEAHFAQAGKVLSAKVIIDRNTGQGKGFAFVEMMEEQNGNNAINALHETELSERTITVSKAKPRTNSSSFSSSSSYNNDRRNNNGRNNYNSRGNSNNNKKYNY